MSPPATGSSVVTWNLVLRTHEAFAMLEDLHRVVFADQ